MSNGPGPAFERRGVRVSVRGLRKSYNGTPVLKGISFEVEPGEVFVIMGPSGSGKTVLLKQLIGLETPDEGEILLDGRPLGAPGLREQVRLAMVFQSGALLNSLTVGQNVGLYLSEHRLKPPAEIERIVDEKLQLLGLRGIKDRWPGELSGGMRKRVAIARALVSEPHLLLYDEPTSELDPLSAVIIGDEILNLRQRIGVTSIVITHDRDLAFGIGDRLAMMVEGELRATGRAEDIRRASDPIIQRFLHAEFKPSNHSGEP